MILRIVAYGTVFLAVRNRGTLNVSVGNAAGESETRTNEWAEDDYFASIMLTACYLWVSKMYFKQYSIRFLLPAIMLHPKLGGIAIGTRGRIVCRFTILENHYLAMCLTLCPEISETLGWQQRIVKELCDFILDAVLCWCVKIPCYCAYVEKLSTGFLKRLVQWKLVKVVILVERG